MPVNLGYVRSIILENITPAVLFGWVVTSVIVAFAGPFGTFESRPFGWRLAYWGGLIAVAIVISVAFRVFWRQIIKGDPAWLEDVAVIGSLAAIFGPAVTAFNTRLTGPEVYTSLGWFSATVITFGVGFSIVVLRRLMQGGPGWPAPYVQPRDRLLDRVSAPEGARLAWVSSDNHYVRIATMDGEEFRILMRLRDAVNEIDVEPGFCVHRSHWVAVAHISEVTQHKGREMVTLSCGQHLPVGPTYRKNLVQAGILAA